MEKSSNIQKDTQRERPLMSRQKDIHRLIPKKFWDIETDKSLDKYKDELCSLFIHGKAGVGKTVLACSLAKLYIKQGYDVKFISYPSFIMELQGMFRQDKDVYGYAREIAWHPEYQDTLARLNDDPIRKGILIIDDLGATKISEFVQQITYYIINEREMKMLPTIITSNFNLNEINTIIDPRVSSRITGMCEIKKLDGADRRKK